MTTEAPVLDTIKIDDVKPTANQAAADKSAMPTKSSGVCPLSQEKIQLLPLRYALVETLKPDATVVADQPLKRHPIGIRFIRDGYLYLYDVGNQIFYEYSLENGVVKSLLFKGKKVTENIRNGCMGEPTLIFDKTETMQIDVSYSEIQWSAEKCNFIIENAEGRSQVMQNIGLWNVNCEHQNQHLITHEKAKKYLAEQNDVIAPLTSITPLFDTETKAYSWEEKDISNYTKAPISKVSAQLASECKGGNFVYLLVNDYIGMMRDLASEQIQVTKWLKDWSEQGDAIGTNELKFTMGNYIDSTLNVNDNNAQSKGASKFLHALSETDKQAIYDHVNAYIEQEHFSGEKYQAIPDDFGGIAYELTKEYQSYVDKTNATETKMKATLGDDLYRVSEDDIEDLKSVERKYQLGDWKLNRGIAQLIKLPELKQYLATERPRITNWQNSLEQITHDRMYLYTNYFHLHTWYYDNTNDDQLTAALQCEFDCVADMLRNSESIEQMEKFIDAKPEFRLPAFQTNFNYAAFSTAGKLVSKLYRERGELLNVLQGKTPLTDLENAIGRNYLKKVLDMPSNAQSVHNLIGVVESKVIERKLEKIFREMTTELFSEGQKTVTSKTLTRFERLNNKLGTALKLDFIIAIRSKGIAIINEAPDATLKIQRYINNMLKNTEEINENISKINSIERQLKKIKNNKGRYEKFTDENKENHKAYLEEEKKRIIIENDRRIKTLAYQQEGLQKYISPLQPGEKPFSLQMRVSAEQQALLNYEKEMLSQGFKNGLGVKGSIGLASLKSSFSAGLLVMQVYNLYSAWEDYDAANLKGEKSSIVPMGIAFLGSLSAGLSLFAGFRTSILNSAITHLSSKTQSLAGERLAAKLGQTSLYLGGGAQVLSAIISWITLRDNERKWFESINKGDTVQAAVAIGTLAATYVNTSINTVTAGHVGLTGYRIVRDLKVVKDASIVVWALHGKEFATAMARLTPWGIGFTLAQIAGELAYNYFNLSDSQEWFQYSCWGNKSKGWTLPEHNHHLADVLLQPWVEDKGVKQITEAGQTQYVRVLHLCIPGQNADTLAERPIEWDAVWKNDKQSSQLAQYLKQTATIVNPAAPLTIEWQLPWISRSEWNILFAEGRESLTTDARRRLRTDASIADAVGLGDVLNLRLWHTPDMATNPLKQTEGGVSYKISLLEWDIKRANKSSTTNKTNEGVIIQPVEKTDANLFMQLTPARFKGIQYHG